MNTPPRVVLYNPRAVFYTMPLALLALASALDRRDIDVVIVDGRLEEDAVARVVAAARGALCVGVTVLSGAPIHDALRVSRAVKAAHPSCPVVWGGWHPSLFPDDCLAEPSVDIVVVGQGEGVFREVVARLRDGERLSGRFGSAALRDLNEFPAHDYALIPVARYFALKGRRQVDYVSSQGCRFRCAFCADPTVYARGWTGLAPGRVAAEAEALQRRFGLEELAFQDETFFTHRSRVDQIAEEFLQRNLDVEWTATLRADQAHRMGEALLAKCVRAGLRRVMIGVESGSQATLDRLKKDLRLEHVEAAAEMCVRHQLGAIFNFIVGFPGEDDASIEATLALAKRLRAMHPRFETPIFYYRPYPGNPLADAAGASGYSFPRSLAEWAEFDYVGSRSPWMSDARWRHIERFKFYTRHAWQRGRWRWPLRAASRWRCNRDWYALPIEKTVVEWLRPPQQVS
ncbi:MAG TPA: radical SAM protein [Vicinamibacterales bacterium]|nr:radical SAM protein [Vicinamibacterales bacterium]